MNLYVQSLLSDVARDVGTSTDLLNNLIQFESGWDPTIKNPDPRSSARGLIQFIDDTAIWLGYRDSLDLVTQNPTVEKQLDGPVRNYLKRYGPYPTEQSLYMAVFYPRAMFWPEDQEFSEDVQDRNPGIRTPRDYIDKVNSVIGVKKKSGIFIILASLAIGLIAIDFFTGSKA